MPPLTYQHTVTIASPKELEEFASHLALFLQSGDVVALDGNLGAGKTTLVQAIGKALGLSETVSSPTFVLMNEYHSGPFPMIHADLYRLGPERADSLAEELLALAEEGQSLILVEWACYSELLKPIFNIKVDIDFAAPSLEPVASAPSEEVAANDARVITLQANRPLPDFENASAGGAPHE